MKILVTGGCGYVGTPLTETLLSEGHQVAVIDTQWFGNYLRNHENLRIIKMDIRNSAELPDEDFDSVIHLANIANDPSVDLNPTLSWEVNVLATYGLLNWSKSHGVKQFIYASSGSVYGVRTEPSVDELLDPMPISTYNKTKMIAEQVVMNAAELFQVICVRPATICGFSKRMRLDLAVNMLTYQALTNGKIKIFGGDQIRPNIHIEDMVATYQHFLKNKDIASGFYNAGFENLSIRQIAEQISSVIPSQLEFVESNDPRSYRQDSAKLIATGYSPRKKVLDAIIELQEKFRQGNLVDSQDWHTVDKMVNLGLGVI